MNNKNTHQEQVTPVNEVDPTISLGASSQEAVDSTTALSQQTADFLGDPSRVVELGHKTLEGMTDEQLREVLTAAESAEEAARRESYRWKGLGVGALNVLGDRARERQQEASKEAQAKWDAEHPKEVARREKRENSQGRRSARRILHKIVTLDDAFYDR
jgi:hypothetical protein